MRISVLGAGNGGYAAAADFTRRGHQVTLFELPQFASKIASLQADSRLEMVDIDGNHVAEIRVHRVTSNIQDAVSGADVILNPVPIFGVPAFAATAAPYLEPGQYVFTFGKGGASLIYAKSLRQLGKEGVFLGETNTLPYGATRQSDHRVRIEAPVSELITGSFPARNTPAVVAKLSELYPAYHIRTAANVLECLLVDYNAITHTPPMICNAARIASGFHAEEFHLFGKFENPPPVVELIKAIDRERMAISEALGIKAYTLEEEIAHVGWGPKGKEREVLDLYEAIHTEKLEVCEGPWSLTARHLTEDVPWGLVAYSSLGKLTGVPTPVSDAITTLASVLNGEDYWSSGRTLESMGLDPAWSIAQLRSYLEEGAALP
ncbi:MAG: NAD/NADP octopine/nopaline dehydrogenase family protein [Bacillota bacterium]